MQSIAYIPGSDGSGNASLMTISTARAANATEILVNTVSGVPTKFYASMGTPHSFTDPVTGENITVISEATAIDFAGHVNSGKLEIDAIAPGYTDEGSSVGDIVIIRPITEWANNIHNILNADHNDDGTHEANTINPVGATVDFPGFTAPSGWLLCYGQNVSRSTYAALFAVLNPSLGTATMTIASPGVVTFSSHPFVTGDAVYFTTTGALPTGVSANTQLFVIVVDANTFKLATSYANAIAGTAINTSGSQSGTHTLKRTPFGVGDGSTTFTIPDLRGRVVAGMDNMGGTAASRLTAPATTGSLKGTVFGNAAGEEAHVQTNSELSNHFHGYHHYGALSKPQGTGPNTVASIDFVNENTNTTGSSTAANVVQPTLVMNKIIKT